MINSRAKVYFMETIENYINRDINCNKKIIKYKQLYSVKSLIIKLLLKSGIFLNYSYPYILSMLIMLNIGFYKKHKPFDYSSAKKIKIEHIYDSNNNKEINYDTEIIYDNDYLIYRTPWELIDGKYVSKEAIFLLNQDELSKPILPSLLKMNYDEIKSFFKIKSVKTIYKNDKNVGDAQVIVVLHDETISSKIVRQIDLYSALYIILVLLEGLGISKFNKIIFKTHISDKLNELDKGPIIYSKKEIDMINEIIENDRKNLEYINNNHDKPKLRIK